MEAIHSGQPIENLLGNPVRKIGLVPLRRHICKRQNGDGIFRGLEMSLFNHLLRGSGFENFRVILIKNEGQAKHGRQHDAEQKGTLGLAYQACSLGLVHAGRCEFQVPGKQEHQWKTQDDYDHHEGRHPVRQA